MSALTKQEKSCSFLLQSIGVAEVRHFGGHMQHTNSPMTKLPMDEQFFYGKDRQISFET